MASRTATSGTAVAPSKPQSQSAQMPMALPHEKVAMRAYEKWRQRGCPCGTDKQDWAEAEAELRLEMARTGAPATRR